MKKVFFSALAALALAGSGAAFAADAPVPAVQASMAGVGGVSIVDGDYRLGVGEFEDFAHGYHLKTGEKVYFTRHGKQRFYVQLEGRKRERMFAQSRGVFMTESGARVEFSEFGHAVAITTASR